jgi:hypothetical protein
MYIILASILVISIVLNVIFFEILTDNQKNILDEINKLKNK